MSSQITNSPKVFISYSWDSPAHKGRVLEISDRLVNDGIDCILDQYVVSPPEGWPRWMERQIREADFVLIICTETYLRRVLGEESPGKGHGVRWEGHLTYQDLYDAGTLNTKFIPVLLESGKFEHIPKPLRGSTVYYAHTEEGYEALYRHLTNQPSTPKRPVGKLRQLASHERKQNFSERTLGSEPELEEKGQDNCLDVDDSPPAQTGFTSDFFAYDDAWVGREQLVAELSEKVRGSCRLLLLVGITGIGKTALAERLAVELQDWFSRDWKNKFKRANFDYEDKATDFASVAARWLEEWGEKVLPIDKKPERLLQRLVVHLRENQVLVLIDSLEKLLMGNEEEGWGDFADEWWEKFFLSLLSAESCQSRLIVTSQDLPVKLVNSHWKNFWHLQVLYGLDESEQEAFFKRKGLDVSQDSPDRPLLMRLGKAYKGHPLVLRVIIGEICESFDGNVQAYWSDVSSKIEDVEKALAEAEADARKVMGADDDWKLHKLTRKIRLEVNRQRLKSVFERLESQVRDAYILICAASVYRAPVQEEGWLMQLVNLVKRLEHQQCNEDRQEKALEELCNRFLVEESVNHNNRRVLGQHNLVRSVALEHYKQLLQRFKTEAKLA